MAWAEAEWRPSQNGRCNNVTFIFNPTNTPAIEHFSTRTMARPAYHTGHLRGWQTTAAVMNRVIMTMGVALRQRGQGVRSVAAATYTFAAFAAAGAPRRSGRQAQPPCGRQAPQQEAGDAGRRAGGETRGAGGAARCA